MNILVVGNGGREHALVWKLSEDSRKPRIFCAPGNAGTAALAVNLPIEADQVEALTAWAAEHRPDLTVIGPEAPLCAGLTDRLAALGLPVFGPCQAAARLEGSKIFAKEIMRAAGVPTAQSESFESARAAVDYVRALAKPVVIKADGLAAGKGVTVCDTVREAEQAIHDCLVAGAFGAAGHRVLVEERLAGEEASILALIDGEHVVMLASSQDHKRLLNGDLGPNTGGMGAYSPAPVVTDDLWPVIRAQVFERTLAELRRRGIVYRGILYAGLMLTADGPKVLEFNCRFGDPETQAILPRWAGDMLPALEACVAGTLHDGLVRWLPAACLCTVMASGGYPGAYAKGVEIKGLERADAREGVRVFHAGTRRDGDRVVTAGGRVLGVTALGADLREARRRVHGALTDVTFDQAQYRTDIGFRALRQLDRQAQEV